MKAVADTDILRMFGKVKSTHLLKSLFLKIYVPILPSRDWLSRMIEPFQDREIVGTKAAVLYLSEGGWVYYAILRHAGDEIYLNTNKQIMKI